MEMIIRGFQFSKFLKFTKFLSRMQQVSVSISGNDHQSLKCFDDQEIWIPNKFLLNNKKFENFQISDTQIAKFPKF